MAHASVSESRFGPATVETVRITNVNIEDWSIDCVSEYGNKNYFDIPVMSPYFHYANGEGIYVVPEVGAMGWLCIPSSGRRAGPFLLGFQAPHDEDNDSFRCGRQTFTPGDIVLRTRDENFLTLRRGGVVQIGATPTAQRMYIPINNVIRDFCENYELNTFGGELLWKTVRPDKSDKGDGKTKLSILAKQKSDDPKHIAELSMGSHEGDDALTMELKIWSDGTKNREIKVTLQITNTGDVYWDIQQDYITRVKGEMQTLVEKDTYFETKENFIVDAAKQIDLSADTKYLLSCDASEVTAKSNFVVDCSSIKLGSAGASEPAILGNQLVTVLNAICTVINAGIICVAPGSPAVGAAISSAQGMISGILAQKVKVE